MASLLMHHPECSGQWVTIQKEVVDRLVANPWHQSLGPFDGDCSSVCHRTSHRGLAARVFLAVSQSHECDGGAAAMPPTRVQSDPDGFARFVTKLLSQRRKQIGGILGA